jgi:hypothetical protein
VTTVKQWSAEAVEAALDAQGIRVAPGRTEKLARGQQALLAAGAADPLRATLAFEADPPSFVLALARCAAR